MERVNGTLKSKLNCYFTAVNSLRYIDVLQYLVDSYNNTYHRSIGRAPATDKTQSYTQFHSRKHDGILGYSYNYTQKKLDTHQNEQNEC